MRYCSLNLFIWATLSGATLLICASSVRAQEPVKKPLLPAFTLDSDVRLREEARSASSFAGGSNPQDAFNRVRLGMRYRDRNGWMLFLQPSSLMKTTGASPAPSAR
jgi:hypothetical protein